jgi:PAS domain S-box-containing protein
MHVNHWAWDAEGGRPMDGTGGETLEMFEGVGDGAFAVDADSRIVMWNSAAERLLGFPREAVVGRPCHEVFAGRDRSGNLACFPGCQCRALVERGEPVRHFDLRVRRANGEEAWLNVSTIPIRQPDGTLRATVHLFRTAEARADVGEMVEAVLERLGREPAPARSIGMAAALDRLSRREVEVLALLANGAGSREVAERLCISLTTVRNHTQNILTKLGVHSKVEAVALALRQRLV